jgi:NAD(P)-dependent dehydrogenase (short-subunit alcohol dehydrogenase family)
VCAASKGLGKGCAEALAAEGVNVVITARGAEALEATAAELRALNPAVQVRTVAGDITTPRAAPRAGRLPAGGHPGQQRRRPAAGRLPRLGPRRLDQGAGRQHADARSS